MIVKGALHVHSIFSSDGTLTIADLVEWYSRKGYQFVAMSEHSEDLDDSKAQALAAHCAGNCSPQFCVVPGIEFSCAGGIHIPAFGVVKLTKEKDPLAVTEEIHQQGGYVVLAHPRRIGWQCPSELLLAVDAVEIWNVGSDGKFLPSAQALGAFRKMQQVNPELLAVASHDFHRKDAFYDVAIQMDLHLLTREAILRHLREGRYEIRSRFFRADSHARLTWARAASLRLISSQLSNLRKARSFLQRDST